jgi:LuxR family transcriptional regulator, maltose regulon positive regulatory protein
VRRGVGGSSFGTKLDIPVLPKTWNLRDRLDALLTRAMEHRLTIVTGPPGSGKSVLLSAWARRHPERRVAWVSLDASDDDPERFWSMVVSALSAFAPLPRGRQAASDATVPGSDVQAAVATASVLPAVTLILDDIHTVSHQSIVSDLAYLVRNLPPQTSIVLSGREDPALPLHRLRVDGHLVEIREHDLRFDVREAADLVEAVAGTKLDARPLEVLVERTEGWAVGLQLAALSLRDEQNPSDFVERFAGTTHLVAEYLMGEVLDQLPSKLVRFLLLTSVLDQMSGPLCQEITGATDSTAILDELVARHLFVVHVDAEHTWYRYHQLFADMLRHTLHARDPQAMAAAHLKTAGWFETEGDFDTAIAHFVAAGALERAFDLAASVLVEQMESGIALDGAFHPNDAIPEPYFLGDPVRMYERAAALLVGLHHREGTVWLHRVQRHIRDVSAMGWLQSRVELLWAIRDWLEGNGEGILLHQRRFAVLSARESEPREVPDEIRAMHPWLGQLDRSADSLMMCLTARAHNWLGDPEAARQALALECERPESVESVAVPGILAVAAANQGNLADAFSWASGSLQMATEFGLDNTTLVIDAHVALGSIHLERNELDQSEQHLRAAHRLCRQIRGRAWSAPVEIQLVALHQARGHEAESFSLISRLRENEADGALPTHIRLQLDLAEVRGRLIAGDFEGAFNRIGQIEEDRRPVSLEGWIDLCAGRPDEAIHRITTSARPAGSLREELERLVVVARGSIQGGAPRRARDALQFALQRARPERYVRLFLDHGDSVIGVLRSLKSRFPDSYLEELLSQASPADEETIAESSGALIEALTQRERAALTLLPSHLTQQQIASELFVSLNTLKTHLKGLYRKLGATSRGEAITLARRYGLL